MLHVCLGGTTRSRTALARLLPQLAREPYRHPTAILTDDHPVLLRRASRAQIPHRVLEAPPASWYAGVRARLHGRALARQVGARVVHAHGYEGLGLALRVASGLGVPLLFSADDAPPRAESLGLNGCRPTRAFTSLTAYREEAERLLRCPVEVVPCAVDPRDYGGDHAPQQVVHDLSLDPTTLHIGMAADFRTPGSGGEVFVEAAALTLSRIPFCEFVVIGDGPDRDRIEGLAHRARILGRFRFLPYTVSLPRMLLALNAIAFPGDPVTYPWELLDAAASPVPIVAADHAVYRELLAGALKVDWVPAGSAEELARCFLRLLDRVGNPKGRGDGYLLTRSTTGGELSLVRSRPSSTGYDLSSGEMSEYEILADDFTRRRELVFRRHALRATLERLSAAYAASSETPR